MQITHSTVVVQPNNPADPVSANAWNASHTITANASTLLGNPTGSSGNVQEITLGSGLSFSGTTIVASGGSTTLNAYSILGNNTNASATGTSVQYPILGVPGYTTSGFNFAQITGASNNFSQLSLQNTTAGTSSSTDYVATADDGTDSTHYTNWGINSSLGATSPFTTAHAAYLYTVDNELDVGALGASGVVNFYTTGGTSSPVKAGFFDATQNLNLTNALKPAQGGTGLATLTAHAVILGEGTSNVGFATIGNSGALLIDQGSGVDPSFNIMSGDATISNSGAFTLATVNSQVGQYSYITLNGKGLATGATMQTTKNACRVATTTGLSATYNNGSSGVGATLTNVSSQVALSIDSVSLSVGDRVMVANQASLFQNGIYTVTNAGSGSTNWVLTRATDFDNSTTNQVIKGASTFIVEGTTNAGVVYIMTTSSPVTLGSTNLNFIQNTASGVVGGYAASVSNSDGTLTISPTTGAVVASLNLAHANTWTANAGSSAPAIVFSGTTFSGTGTSSTPLVYINAGTAPTTWSTNGTQFGINAASGFTGNMIDIHLNGGASSFKIDSTGAMTTTAAATMSKVSSNNQFTSSSAGAASIAVFQTTGGLFASGTGTTNFPQWFANGSGATAATNWSTSGTVYGANFHTSVGNFADYKIDGTTQYMLNGVGKITNYAAVATAGWGVPAIYGSGRSTAQTAAVASVAAYTVGAADGSFIVSCNVLVTASTTHSFTVTCTYTDEGNTSRTLTLNLSQITGTFLTAITNVQGVGAYEGVPLQIRCKASTSITIATTGTFTSVTYNVEGAISQIS